MRRPLAATAAAAGRPKPRNRTPTTQEIERYCAAVLTDIRRCKPAMIAALGSTAARLFGKSQSIRAARKAKLQFRSYPPGRTPAAPPRLSKNNGSFFP
jgi:DNA polymerase